MNLRVSAGPPATPQDRRAARATVNLLSGELARIRATATAWRNGLGALMAGLVGFGLVRGRQDVGLLAPPYDAVAGALLLGALLSGAAGASWLLRAAHGRPAAVAVREVISRGDADPLLRGELAESGASARAMRHGVWATFACAALLCAAVATTWYGPARQHPQLEVKTSTGVTWCGDIVELAWPRLTLRTRHGVITLDLRSAAGLAAVTECAA
jgi:hypothetical protein